jgi:hypothetical protein
MKKSILFLSVCLVTMTYAFWLCLKVGGIELSLTNETTTGNNGKLPGIIRPGIAGSNCRIAATTA